ncbi:heme-binding protein, partial [Mesorhizobium sp. M4B.F.Ca.ET.088.02.2.1]
ISDVSGGRVLPVVGGVLIRDHAGAVIGAVGISGDTSDNDEAVAIAGIEAAGFTADPG